MIEGISPGRLASLDQTSAVIRDRILAYASQSNVHDTPCCGENGLCPGIVAMREITAKAKVGTPPLVLLAGGAIRLLGDERRRAAKYVQALDDTLKEAEAVAVRDPSEARRFYAYGLQVAATLYGNRGEGENE